MTFVDSNPVLAPNPRSSEKGTIAQSKDEASNNFDTVFKSLGKQDSPKQPKENPDQNHSVINDVLAITDVAHSVDVEHNDVLPERTSIKTTFKPAPSFEQAVHAEERPHEPKMERSQSLDKTDSKSPVSDMLELLQTAPAELPDQGATTAVVSVNSVLPQPQLTPLASDAMQKVEPIIRSDNLDRKSAVSSVSSSTTEKGESSDTEAPMPTEPDKTFRFARADGKGTSVNVAISALADSARRDTAPADADKVETVTVLDSRRYLGLPATNNVALISSVVAKEAALVHTGQSSFIVVDDATSKVVNTLKLQLTPIELGSVVATLRLSGEALNVELRVETGAAYRQLSDDQSAIIKTLQAQGFEIDQINVRLVSSDVAAVQTDNHAGQQSRQGQQGSFTQNQQQQSNPQSSSRDDRRARDDTRGDQTPVNSPDIGIRGGVYL